MADDQKYYIYKLNEYGQGPEIVRQALLESGWVEFDEDEHAEHQWNLWWKTSRFCNSEYDSLMPWQRLNHYPKSTVLTKKDGLLRNVRRMQGVHGNQVYNFIPPGFNLPNDYTRFVAEYTRIKNTNKSEPVYWICKPADMSRGRGIFLFKDLSDLQYNCTAVVQQYISNPMLISGYKFDLRIYAVVTDFQPLRTYIFREGLVRFSTEKYDLSSLGNHFSHLTNSSINKHGPMYFADKERIGTGCKWTLSQLRHYLHQNQMDNGALFMKIINIVNLTLLMQASQSVPASGCFELFGIDIMIDENMKPWLLEVNYSPALGVDCQADVIVKKALIQDIVSLMGFIEKDLDHGGPEYKQQQEQLAASQPTRFAPDSKSRRRSIDLNKSSRRRSNFSRFPRIPGLNVGSRGRDGRERRGSLFSLRKDRNNNNHPDSGRSSADSEAEENEGFESNEESTTRTEKILRLKRKPPYDEKYKKMVRENSNPSVSKPEKASDPTSGLFKQVSKSAAQMNDSGLSSCGSGGSASNSDVVEADPGAADELLVPVLKTVPESEFYDVSKKQNLSDEEYYLMVQKRLQSSPTLLKSKEALQNNAEVHTVSYGKSLLRFQSLQSASEKQPVSKYPAKAKLNRVPIQNQSSRQPKTYDKPWRKTVPSQEKPGAEPVKPMVGAIRQVEECGGLVLVYPFNEVTRRPSKVGSDQKHLVKECQKFMKHMLGSLVESEGRSDGKGREDLTSRGSSRPTTSGTQRTHTSTSSHSNSTKEGVNNKDGSPKVARSKVMPVKRIGGITTKSSIEAGEITYTPNLWRPLKTNFQGNGY